MNRKIYMSPVTKYDSLTLEKGMLVSSDAIIQMGVENNGQQIDGYYEENDLMISDWE